MRNIGRLGIFLIASGFWLLASSAAAQQVSRSGQSSLSGQATSSPVIFKNGFEEGTFSAWDAHIEDPANNFGSMLMNSNPTYVRTGSYSALGTYIICTDSGNPDCGAAHQDSNNFFTKRFNNTNGYPNGLDHIFARAYFKFHINTGGRTDVGRKLFYLKAPDVFNGDWSMFFGAALDYTWTFGNDYTGANPCGLTVTGNWDATPTYTFDTWYAVEVEVQANTPGQADGWARMWVNGTMVKEKTNWNIRGSCTSGIGRVEIGRMADRPDYTVNVNELHAVDDLKISSGYIGP